MRFGPATLSTIEPKWLRATMRWLTPLVASTVLYTLAYTVSLWVFDVQIQWERVPYDFGLLLAIAYLLFWASRRIWAYLLLLTVLVGVAYIGSAAKITYLDRPIMPEDIYNVSALFRILGAWGWPIVALPLAAIAGLFLFNLRLTGRCGRPRSRRCSSCRPVPPPRARCSIRRWTSSGATRPGISARTSSGAVPPCT